MKVTSTYQADVYRPRLEEAQEFQDYVALNLCKEGLIVVNFQSRRYQLEHGENHLGLEIKFDRRFAQTGNLYIETAEKSDPRNAVYVPSGIWRDDNTLFYGIGNYEEFYLFSKRTLRAYHNEAQPVTLENETKTSRGFLLSRLPATQLVERTYWWPDGAKPREPL